MWNSFLKILNLEDRNLDSHNRYGSWKLGDLNQSILFVAKSLSFSNNAIEIIATPLPAYSGFYYAELRLYSETLRGFSIYVKS